MPLAVCENQRHYHFHYIQLYLSTENYSNSDISYIYKSYTCTLLPVSDFFENRFLVAMNPCFPAVVISKELETQAQSSEDSTR